MSIDSILTALPRFLKPSVFDMPIEPELDARELITLGSSVLADYGNGVLIGVVTAWGDEPDSFGDEWFFVEGLFNSPDKVGWGSTWLTRAAVIEVIEL